VSNRYRYQPTPKREASSDGRGWIVLVLLGVAFITVVARLFQLQIIEHSAYKLLASDQHAVQAQLVPKRGSILLQDRYDGSLHPVVKDRETWQVYSIRREIRDATSTASSLATILSAEAEPLLFQMMYATSSYQVLAKDVSLEKADEIRAQRFPGIGLTKGPMRFYPEQGLGGQLFGFVSTDEQNKRVGRYGIESSFQKELAGG